MADSPPTRSWEGRGDPASLWTGGSLDWGWLAGCSLSMPPASFLYGFLIGVDKNRMQIFGRPCLCPIALDGEIASYSTWTFSFFFLQRNTFFFFFRALSRPRKDGSQDGHFRETCFTHADVFWSTLISVCCDNEKRVGIIILTVLTFLDALNHKLYSPSSSPSSSSSASSSSSSSFLFLFNVERYQDIPLQSIY